MSHNRENPSPERSRRTPFWPCFLVFAVLAVDGGLRFNRLRIQHKQINDLKLVQATNRGQMADMLSQQSAVEAKLQALSVDLIRVARTNVAAAQIVREFNIQWTPPAVAPTNSAPPRTDLTP